MKLKTLVELVAFSAAVSCAAATPGFADAGRCRHVGGGNLKPRDGRANIRSWLAARAEPSETDRSRSRQKTDRSRSRQKRNCRHENIFFGCCRSTLYRDDDCTIPR